MILDLEYLETYTLNRLKLFENVKIKYILEMWAKRVYQVIYGVM